MSTPLSTCIYAATYGKETVVLEEILPYLLKRINPTNAVRAYLRSRALGEPGRGTNVLPLEDQIKKGMRRLIRETLLSMKGYGYLTHEWNTEDYTKTEISLTEKGKEHANRKAVWLEMRHACQQGFLTVSITVNNRNPY